jgi:hypothetical protein
MLFGTAVATSDHLISLRRSSQGENEQGGEHPGREFDGDAIDPVEGFVAREVVQHFGRALTNENRELVEVRTA